VQRRQQGRDRQGDLPGGRPVEAVGGLRSRRCGRKGRQRVLGPGLGGDGVGERVAPQPVDPDVTGGQVLALRVEAEHRVGQRVELGDECRIGGVVDLQGHVGNTER